MTNYSKNWTRNYNLSFMYTYVWALSITAKTFLNFSILSATGARNENRDMSWMKTEDKNKFDNISIQLFLSSLNKFNNYIRLYNKLGDEFQKTAKKINKLDFKKYSNKSLARVYKQFETINRKFMIVGQFTGYELGLLISDYIKDKLEKAKIKSQVIDEILPIILTPFKTKAVSKMEEEILQTAYNIKTKKVRQNDFNKIIKKLVKKYGWIPSMLIETPLWDEKFFRDKIQELGNLSNINKQMDISKKMKMETMVKKRQFGELLLQYDDFKDLFKIANQLSFIRDERDETRRYCYFLSGPLYKEMAKREKISIKDFFFITPEEILEWLEGMNSLPSALELKHRQVNYVIRNAAGQLQVYSGKKALSYIKKYLPEEKVQRKIKALSGIVACPGIITGTAKLISNKQDLSKIKPGDIMIALTTHPDYLQAMKKLKAIITDEGGLTCHTAIVAREFKIPCLVGTKYATQIFKNGDLLEVNADKGIVRKIK